MVQDGSTRIIGLIAMIVGVMLVMGGLMFLLAMSLNDLPGIARAPGAVQIGIGVAAVGSGFLMYRGHAAATFLLIPVTVGFIGNCIFLAWTMMALATP